MKKFECIEVSFNGMKMYQIRALRDFSDVKAGDLGGYIEKESNLSHEGDCWLYGNAAVYDNAKVSDHAWVLDNAIVSGNAKVRGNAIVSNNAKIDGSAKVEDLAVISGKAVVTRNSIVCGHASVRERAVISDSAVVNDNAIVSGNTIIDGRSRVGRNALVCGKMHVSHEQVVFWTAKPEALLSAIRPAETKSRSLSLLLYERAVSNKESEPRITRYSLKRVVNELKMEYPELESDFDQLLDCVGRFISNLSVS